MNLFIKNIIKLSFLTFLLILASILVKELDVIYTSKRLLFETDKKNIEGLVTGTSHSYFGINPKVFPLKIINIAEINKPVDVDIEILEKNLNTMPNLKFVIIPIDYFTIYFSGQNEGAAAKLYHHWNLKGGMVNNYYFKRYHYFTCGYSIYDEMLKKYSYDSTLGYCPQYDDFSKLTNEQQTKYCINRLNDWNKYWIDTSSTKNIQIKIERLINLLKEKNIYVFFVTMPLSQVLLKNTNSKIWDQNSIFLHKILKYKNVSYLDLTRNTLFNNDSLFADGDHLNYKGATIASTEIKNKILSLIYK